MKKLNLILIVVYTSISYTARSQNVVNYDESKITPYQLPELLVSQSGKRISDKEEWTATRRSEILDEFKRSVYGQTPESQFQIGFKLDRIDDQALAGLAVKKEISISFETAKGRKQMTYFCICQKTAGIKSPCLWG